MCNFENGGFFWFLWSYLSKTCLICLEYIYYVISPQKIRVLEKLERLSAIYGSFLHFWQQFWTLIFEKGHKVPEVVDKAKVLKMFLFRCKSCLNNIIRCFMKFEAKWTTPVVWAEILFKFWHWMFTYRATTLYPGPLFTSKHDRSASFMIRNRLTCWKPDLVGFGFPPFLAPLVLIF
jgi:hypothetical protein